jgi:type II secretory pathway predicted ATPase ExeA/cell division septation protein DedD
MMGYEQFFGLNDAPFSLAPNPRYLFDSVSHTAALEQLARAIERREPLIVMTGEIGTGKTLLCRTVLQRVDRKTFVSVINNPRLDADDLLKQMLQDFGVISTDRAVVSAASRHDLVHALEDFLSSLIVLDAHAVIIIDEAQHVQPDVLEQIRLLSNIDAPSGTKLQIILAGQLDLESLLARPELRQLQQRVSRRIRLEPLGEAELRSYIDHRLAVGRAAGSGMPGAGELARALVEWQGAEGGVTFTPDAVQAIWRWSRGLPRVVNLICDRALEAACAQRLRTIDAGQVDAAANALGLSGEAAPVPAAAAPAPVEVKPPPSPVQFHFDSPPPSQADFAPPPIAADFELLPAPERSRVGIIAVLIALVIVAAVAAYFVTRAPAKPVSGSPVTRGEGASPAAAPAAAPPPAPAPGPAAAPAPATPPSGTAPPPPPSAAAAPGRQSAPPAAASASGSFEIVVASFRTEPRAAAVEAQVTAAGLAVRRREVGGWLQVIAGPFPTREAADLAHQRLETAGLPGTQIVATTR